jgi:hypothetical protein
MSIERKILSHFKNIPHIIRNDKSAICAGAKYINMNKLDKILTFLGK